MDNQSNNQESFNDNESNNQQLLNDTVILNNQQSFIFNELNINNILNDSNINNIIFNESNINYNISLFQNIINDIVNDIQIIIDDENQNEENQYEENQNEENQNEENQNEENKNEENQNEENQNEENQNEENQNNENQNNENQNNENQNNENQMNEEDQNDEDDENMPELIPMNNYDNEIENMIINRSYSERYRFLEDTNYLNHYDDTIYNILLNEIIPYLYQWDDTRDDFLRLMFYRLYDNNYTIEQVYYNIGTYLYLNENDNNTIEDDMNRIRRHILRGRQRSNISLVFNVLDNSHSVILPLINEFLGSLQQPQMESVKLVVPQDELDKINIIKYNSIENEKDEKCLICQECFIESDDVRDIKCKHLFHCHCLDPWLLDNSYKCPTCREPIAEHKPKL